MTPKSPPKLEPPADRRANEKKSQLTARRRRAICNKTMKTQADANAGGEYAAQIFDVFNTMEKVGRKQCCEESYFNNAATVDAAILAFDFRNKHARAPFVFSRYWDVSRRANDSKFKGKEKRMYRKNVSLTWTDPDDPEKTLEVNILLSVYERSENYWRFID